MLLYRGDPKTHQRGPSLATTPQRRPRGVSQRGDVEGCDNSFSSFAVGTNQASQEPPPLLASCSSCSLPLPWKTSLQAEGLDRPSWSGHTSFHRFSLGFNFSCHLCSFRARKEAAVKFLVVGLVAWLRREEPAGRRAPPPGQQVHVSPFFPPPSLHSLFLSAERAPPRRPFLLLCGPSLQPHHTEPNHGETNVPVLLLLLLLLNSILQKP